MLVKSEISPSSNANCLDIHVDKSSFILRPRQRKLHSIELEDDDLADEESSLEMSQLSDSVGDAVEYIGKFSEVSVMMIYIAIANYLRISCLHIFSWIHRQINVTSM
jgi:hypothetical protein